MSHYKTAAERLLRREDLGEELASLVMHEIMDGKLTHAQAGAFLALLAAKGETADELTGFARVLREKATRVNAGDDVMDTCGTGGSGYVTTNTSTIAAFILAAGGVRIAKHGNRASSGRCGSMDVLEALGVPIDLDPRQVESLIGSCGIGFMLAPKFHPAMAHVGPVRRELGFRSTFNFLGPLANPARATMQVLGVSDRRRAALMAEALGRLGTKSALVCTGEDGLDEITLSGITYIWSLRENAITPSTIDPSIFGLDSVPIERVLGGDPPENARIFMAVLEGAENGPIRDLTLINAAAGLLVANRAASLREGFQLAESLLASKKPLEAFERYRTEAKALRS